MEPERPRLPRRATPRASLASGVVNLEEGGTFSAGKLGTYTINAVGDGFQVILGPPTVFDESNVDDFDF